MAFIFLFHDNSATETIFRAAAAAAAAAAATASATTKNKTDMVGHGLCDLLHPHSSSYNIKSNGSSCGAAASTAAPACFLVFFLIILLFLPFCTGPFFVPVPYLFWSSLLLN